LPKPKRSQVWYWHKTVHYFLSAHLALLSVFALQKPAVLADHLSGLVACHLIELARRKTDGHISCCGIADDKRKVQLLQLLLKKLVDASWQLCTGGHLVDALLHLSLTQVARYRALSRFYVANGAISSSPGNAAQAA
jgi:hypothetical protein